MAGEEETDKMLGDKYHSYDDRAPYKGNREGVRLGNCQQNTRAFSNLSNVLFFFVFFPTGLVRLYIAGLPLRSCRTIGAPSVQGSAQCAFFSFLVAAGFELTYFSLGSGHLNHFPILTPQCF